MSDTSKVKFKWLEKIKNVKHIEIIIVVIFAIIMFLIYSSSFKPKKTTSKQTEQSELSINNYLDDLELKLEKTLSKIKGVSDVKVMITLDLSSATIEENIIKSSTFPEIKGILVVAKGVENTNVKLNVLKAIEAVVDINNGSVEILSSN